MIFGIHTIEKIIKKKMEKILLQPKEVHDLKKKESVLVSCIEWEMYMISKVIKSNIVKDRLIVKIEK